MSNMDPFETDLPSLIPVCLNIVTRTLHYLKIDKNPNEVYEDILFGIYGNRKISDSEVMLNDRMMFEAIIRWSETMFLSDEVAGKYSSNGKE